MVLYSNESKNDFTVPAFYNGPAVPQPAHMPFCGDVFPPGTNLCCTYEQLSQLVISTGQQAQGLLSRCPSCYRNFVQFWCLFTCSPNQSMFLTLDSVNDAGIATEITTNVDPVFGNGTFESCDQVRLVDGSSVMLIFGGAQNYMQFFDYLGLASKQTTKLLGIDFTFGYAWRCFMSYFSVF